MAESSGWVPESREPGQKEYPPGYGAAGQTAQWRLPAQPGNPPPPGTAWSYPAARPAYGAPDRNRRTALTLAVAAGTAMVCLAIAVIAGSAGDATLTRKPTAAELSSAAAASVAQRWQRLAAGDIFPSGIGYSTSLLTQETAHRVGIATAISCAASLDSSLATLAARSGCRAVLRAAYVDELQGVIYTVGVLAFPSPRASRSFFSRIPAQTYPATGLRALQLPGTPAARFDDAARQASGARQAGPYIIIAVAGYADGRPAASADERRASVFAPISQLIGSVAGPLDKPAVVNCAMRTQWAC